MQPHLKDRDIIDLPPRFLILAFRLHTTEKVEVALRLLDPCPSPQIVIMMT